MDDTGLNLGFDHVRGALDRQVRTAAGIDQKATGVFSVGTLIFGIALPLSFAGADNVDLATLIAAGLGTVAYVAALAFALSCLRLRYFDTMEDPSAIKQYYLVLSGEEFKKNILEHMPAAHENNDRQIQAKADAFKRLVLATAIEVGLLTAAVWLPTQLN